MTKNQLKKSDANKHYNWLMGADMYLAASVILCDEMLKSYTSPIQGLNEDQQIDKRCGFTSANPDYEMLMPVIFNLKHGVELYLKALIMRINNKQEYPPSHDLLDLLNHLIREIKSKENIGKEQNGIDINILDKNLRDIIGKYYFGLYAFAQQKAYPDINNEAERYPEYRNNMCYIVHKLYELVSKSMLESIKSDCVFLQKTLREDILKKS